MCGYLESNIQWGCCLWASCHKRRTSYVSMCVMSCSNISGIYKLFYSCLNLFLNYLVTEYFFLFPKELFYPLRSDFFSITARVTRGSGIKCNLKKVLTVQLQSQGLRRWQRKMSHLCFLWLCLGQWPLNVITSLIIYFLIKPYIILNFKHHAQ